MRDKRTGKYICYNNMYSLELWGYRDNKFCAVELLYENLSRSVAEYNKFLYEEENVLNGDWIVIVDQSNGLRHME